MTRLALGTVQFGLHYGIANTTGPVGQSEVSAILRRAASAGIDTLDTAINYGAGEQSLGRAGMTGWRVVTKMPPLPNHVIDVRQWAYGQIHGSLARLGVAQLEAVLLHRAADLLGPHGKQYLTVLKELKSDGLTRALGVSIYDPSELNRLSPIWMPEVVQAPCNVLDRRLIHSGWLDRLANCGVRVHVRSAFLQGLLLMPAELRPTAFSRWAYLLDRWTQWYGIQGISPVQGALSFVRELRGVEFAVIGVDSESQLEDCLLQFSAAKHLPPDDLFSDDQSLIDPSRWRAA